MKLIDAVLNFVFPRVCAGCGGSAERKYGYAFCFECGEAFEVEMSELCEICSKEQTMCACLPAVAAHGARYVHLIAYKSDFSKRVIFSLKRKNRAATRNFIARKMAALVGDVGEATITFAPRSRSAVGKYGFDQSEMLARALAREMRKKTVKLFSHRRKSRAQKELGLSERVSNAEESYVLRRGAHVGDGTLIIVDDVITSGSTVGKLCALAHDAGATDIVVLTVAKTPRTASGK